MAESDFFTPKRMRSLSQQAIDFLLPPRCFGCGVGIEQQGSLCADCWSGLHFITRPFCTICGYPFEYDAGDGTLCSACLSQEPPFQSARAVFRYDDGSKHLILSFKHGDKTDGARAFGQLLYRAASDILQRTDRIIPVPLHRWRLFERRFNQSALIGQSLSRLTGLPLDTDHLIRHRSTESQGGLNRRQRHRNVQGAFKVRNGTVKPYHGQTVVLVDDVYTTGATVSACARALLKAGAAEIHVLTLARVAEAARSHI